MTDHECAWVCGDKMSKKKHLVCGHCWEAADEDKREEYKDLLPGRFCIRKLCWERRRVLHCDDAPYCCDHTPPAETPTRPTTSHMIDHAQSSARSRSRSSEEPDNRYGPLMDRVRTSMGPGPDVSGWRSEGLAEFSKACTDELLRRTQGLYPEG